MDLQGLVHNILQGTSQQTELLQSYVRSDNYGSGDDDTDYGQDTAGAGAATRAGSGGAADSDRLDVKKVSAFGSLSKLAMSGGTLLSSSPKQDIYCPIRKESTFDEPEKDNIQPVRKVKKMPKSKSKSAKTAGKAPSLKIKRSKKKGRRRKKKQPRSEELYTDKDRAAAVNMGSKDIKQSLSIKKKLDRTKALQISEEIDPATFATLGYYEMKKNGDLNIAKDFLSKAIELNERNKNALIARSKCNILLGEAEKALDDANSVLRTNKNDVLAIYQKGEALYTLGQFEHSLMYYHRGLRLRPDMIQFRLGIQKAQKAINDTIGPMVRLAAVRVSDNCKINGKNNADVLAKTHRKESVRSATPSIINSDLYVRIRSATPSSSRRSTARSRNTTTTTTTTPTIADQQNNNSRHYLGPLSVDKQYLEKLLKDPHIRCLNTESKTIIMEAQQAITYLNNRQKFWQQHIPPPELKKASRVVSLSK